MISQLTISIDYDDTFTADPDTWSAVIKTLQASGHRVVCCSARRNEHWVRRELEDALPQGVKVFLSYDAPKRLYMESQGVQVDIWIDDMPEAVHCSA